MDEYEIIKAGKKEVYRDAFFSMKLVEAYRSPVLHGYVLEVENLAEVPVLLRVQRSTLPASPVSLRIIFKEL